MIEVREVEAGSELDKRRERRTRIEEAIVGSARIINSVSGSFEERTLRERESS